MRSVVQATRVPRKPVCLQSRRRHLHEASIAAGSIFSASSSSANGRSRPSPSMSPITASCTSVARPLCARRPRTCRAPPSRPLRRIRHPSSSRSFPSSLPCFRGPRTRQDVGVRILPAVGSSGVPNLDQSGLPEPGDGSIDGLGAAADAFGELLMGNGMPARRGGYRSEYLELRIRQPDAPAAFRIACPSGKLNTSLQTSPASRRPVVRPSASCVRSALRAPSSFLHRVDERARVPRLV